MDGSFTRVTTEPMVKNEMALSPDHLIQSKPNLINPFDRVSSPGRRLEVFKSVYSAQMSEPSEDGEEEEIVAVSIHNEPALPNPEETQTELDKIHLQYSAEKKAMQ